MSTRLQLHNPRCRASAPRQRYSACRHTQSAPCDVRSRMSIVTSSGTLGWDSDPSEESDFLEGGLESLGMTVKDRGGALAATGGADKVTAWGLGVIGSFFFPDPDKGIVGVVLLGPDGTKESFEFCSRAALWLTGSAPGLEAFLLDQFDLKVGEATVMALWTVDGDPMYKNVSTCKKISTLVAKSERFEVRKVAA